MESISRSCCYALLLVVAVVAVEGSGYEYDEDLSLSYYRESCPQLEQIVHKKLKLWLKNDSTLAPALINLHYRDCAVRGCDASILLEHEGSERTAKASMSLRGFQVIDDIKSEVEKKCPKTVSCADILASAARDATGAVGGPFWSVPYGRKDGRVSLAEEAESLPKGRERITELVELFQSKGLNVLDLVVLSGAHSIGRSGCAAVQHRLFNYKADPSIDPRYLNFLRRKCRWASESVELDAVTPKKLDVQYYKNLEKKMGLLSTDQMLYSDSRTASIVSALASQPEVFHHQFAASMIKLGNIIDYSADQDAEIRHKCSCVNA
ncbi:peroxidase 7 [Salvia miltiorrhiza]|uniref:peroxidase 7 n=1 Tax=Salvia miltiorrhiza TaxID=226208 RepID=UPI0025AC0771|nr:peroxidase 7 [Salvia miltiorrhiza]